MTKNIEVCKAANLVGPIFGGYASDMEENYIKPEKFYSGLAFPCLTGVMIQKITPYEKETIKRYLHNLLLSPRPGQCIPCDIIFSAEEKSKTFEVGKRIGFFLKEQGYKLALFPNHPHFVKAIIPNASDLFLGVNKEICPCSFGQKRGILEASPWWLRKALGLYYK